MSETEGRDPNPQGSRYSGTGDEDVDVSLMRVRNALLVLPKMSCPVGFEYRLNRRLQGIDGSVRSNGRNWVSGWLGVGMGFAAAAVIAFLVLDFDVPTPVGVSVVQGPVKHATTTTMTQPETEIASDRDPTQTVGDPIDQPMAATDSVPKDVNRNPFSSPGLHQASGNEASKPAQ